MSVAELDDPAGESTTPRPAVTRRAQRREQQTARILDAAKKCFVRSGFQGASMQEICNEAGMSPGALYRYFPSKESIIEAISEAQQQQDAEMLSAMLDNPSVIDGFVEASMAHIRKVHEHGTAALFTEVRAEAMRNEMVRTGCERSMHQVRDALRNYFQKALDRGDIRPRVDLDTLLTVMMALGEGLILNDLPSQGVPMEKIETLMRSAAISNLRPRGYEEQKIG